MKKILVAVLDWGLGHATRSIPVVRELQRRNYQVVLAGSGEALALLQKEFPDLQVFMLPAYSPRYPRAGRSMVLYMALQLPRFVSIILAEHRALQKIVKDEHIDLIISDNRYGCHSKEVPSVLVTHQSNILMPERFGFLRRWVRALNERFMNRFDECWIPDLPPGESLAGDLSTFGQHKINAVVRYVGWLSRFEARQAKVQETLDVLAIFSGPEPQRTLLEDIVVPQLKTSGLSFRAIRGLPSVSTDTGDPRIVNFMTAADLQHAIESASLVIARSGYSTVMDMKALGKKVIFVPTPGQTEQEYLAQRLQSSGVALCVSQDQFDLTDAITRSKKFSGFVSAGNNRLLVRAIEDLLRYRLDKE